MNRLESRYAELLDLRKLAGESSEWRFEPIKFRLAKGCFYSPDFLVIDTEGQLEFHETKGHWEDDARVKIKTAANLYPWFLFVAVTEDKKARQKGISPWKREVIEAHAGGL